MTDTPGFDDLVERVYQKVTQSTIQDYVRKGMSREETIDALDGLFQDKFWNIQGNRGGNPNPFGIVSRIVARIVTDREREAIPEEMFGPKLVEGVGQVERAPEESFTRPPRAQAPRQRIEQPSAPQQPRPEQRPRPAQTGETGGYPTGQGSSYRLYKKLFGG